MVSTGGDIGWFMLKNLKKSFNTVYQWNCQCNALYISATEKKNLASAIEHQKDSFNRKLKSLGIAFSLCG